MLRKGNKRYWLIQAEHLLCPWPYARLCGDAEAKGDLELRAFDFSCRWSRLMRKPDWGFLCLDGLQFSTVFCLPACFAPSLPVVSLIRPVLPLQGSRSECTDSSPDCRRAALGPALAWRGAILCGVGWLRRLSASCLRLTQALPGVRSRFWVTALWSHVGTMVKTGSLFISQGTSWDEGRVESTWVHFCFLWAYRSLPRSYF